MYALGYPLNFILYSATVNAEIVHSEVNFVNLLLLYSDYEVID
jgi:hypothetical protein